MAKQAAAKDKMYGTLFKTQSGFDSYRSVIESIVPPEMHYAAIREFVIEPVAELTIRGGHVVRNYTTVTQVRDKNATIYAERSLEAAGFKAKDSRP